VPLVVGLVLHSAGASWMSLSGFSVALADKGGAYRTRAWTTLSLTVAGALAALLGALAAPHAVVAVALAAVWAGLASLPRVLGAGATSVGVSSTIILIVSLAAPVTSPTAALLRAGWVLVGGLWATLVSLVFWPLRPYKPLRLAIAAVYRQLALHAEHVAYAGTTNGAVPDDVQLIWETDRRRLRQLIEFAREEIVASRRGRPERSERGERLLMLVEVADQLFGSTIAAGELLSFERPATPDRRDEPRRSLLLLAQVSRAAADALEQERELGARQVASIHTPPDDTTASAEVHAVASRTTAFLRIVVQIVSTIEHPERRPTGWPEPVVDAGPSARDLLRSSIEPQSLTLRHALRVAITVAVAVALTRVLPLGRGYWLTLTALIVLQPLSGATMVRVSQRVLGTVVGSAITALVVYLLHWPPAIVLVVVALIVVCVSLLPVNYLLYSVALTPIFVLLAELSAGDWHLAGLRVENTLIGGALALLASWLLWPSSERQRYPELQRAAVIACRDHVREVARLWIDRSEEAARVLATARRQAALATANAESSLDAMLASSAEPDALFEARMSLLVGVRRLVAADTALSALRMTPAAQDADAEVNAVVRAASVVLGDLASAVVEGRAPAPIAPELVATVRAIPESSGLRRVSERIAGQVRVLHDAVSRASTARDDEEEPAAGIGAPALAREQTPEPGSASR
jgi:uncharacterized membrane protein YccC